MLNRWNLLELVVWFCFGIFLVLADATTNTWSVAVVFASFISILAYRDGYTKGLDRGRKQK